MPSIPSSGAPNILNKAYTITAEVTIPTGGSEGMIVTESGRFGGYGLFLSPAFNWWSKAGFFRNLGLGFLAFGLLLVWRGRSKKWSGLKMGMIKKMLPLAAVAEFATGLALLIVPSLAGWLLLGQELTGVAIPVARVLGIGFRYGYLAAKLQSIKRSI